MAEGIQYLGKFLIVLGIIIIALGGLLLLSGKIPWVGRLPGDIIIHRKNFTFYFPVVTSILLSLLLTLIFWLLRRR
jgi:ribose/xylose/arabinose/galactoside ABC-type transport system permease subunit